MISQSDSQNGNQRKATPPTLSWREWSIAGVLFLILLVIYQVDWIPGMESAATKCNREYFQDTIFPLGVIDCYTTDDSSPNLLLARTLLTSGFLSFSSAEASPMLQWKYAPHGPEGPSRTLQLLEIDDEVQALIAGGTLQTQRGYYMVVPSRSPDRFANTFGGGAGLTAVPLTAAVKALGDSVVSVTDSSMTTILDLPGWQQAIGRWTASACVAGSAVFFFLVAARHLSIRLALLLAFSYGLGTCVYSVSSQSLWQHGPTELFLAMGIYFLSRVIDYPRTAAALSGSAFAWATWCRPTSVVSFACVAIYLLVINRRALFYFLATGVPVGLLLMLFNTFQFGGPFKFGQTELAVHAEEKTGSPEIWQTPLGYGAVASLLSPSRGLFVYSPFLVFSLFGAASIWRDQRWSFLRPLPFAILAVWVIEFQHFDWWGGWSFGYRHIIDTVILMVFLLIPVIHAVVANRWLRILFLLMVFWSVGVQLIGTFLYDRWGWNCRPGYLVAMPGEDAVRWTYDPKTADDWAREGGTVHFDYFNIDNPAFRGRLWSVRQSQLVYYLANAAEAYQSKQAQVRYAQRSKQTKLAETYDKLGQAACALDQTDIALRYFTKALAIQPALLNAFFHFRALDPNSRPPAPQDTASNENEAENLNHRIREVLDRLARDRLDEALALIDETGHQRSFKSRHCLILGLKQLRDGQRFSEISPPIQPMFQRLSELCDRFKSQ